MWAQRDESEPRQNNQCVDLQSRRLTALTIHYSDYTLGGLLMTALTTLGLFSPVRPTRGGRSPCCRCTASKVYNSAARSDWFVSKQSALIRGRRSSIAMSALVRDQVPAVPVLAVPVMEVLT
jgi:hypothetical protein